MRSGERRRRARRAAFDARGRVGGYTYLLVLFLVAGLGLMASEIGVVWQHAAQREREADLLAIGVEFAHALDRYRKASPAAVLPERLEELVADGRGGTAQRHLRRVYRDPFTGQARWGTERVGGRIVGVYSLAPGEPIRKADLPPELGAVGEEAASYAAWVFRPADEELTQPGADAAQVSPAATK